MSFASLVSQIPSFRADFWQKSCAFLLFACGIGLHAAPYLAASAQTAALSAKQVSSRGTFVPKFSPTTQLLFPKNCIEGTLPNGFRYVILPNALPSHRAEIRLVLNVGSAVEDTNQRGHAHFIEHLAFGGTKSYPQRRMVEFWEKHGMKFGEDINAMTGYDRTVYQTAVPCRPDSMSLLLETLPMVAEWMGQMSIAPERVAQEKAIIAEEIRAYDAGDDFFELKHGKGVYNRLPIGTATEVNASTAESLRRFYAQWYAPHRATLVVVGDVDAKKLQKMVEQTFAVLPSNKAKATIPAFRYDNGVRMMVVNDALQTDVKAEIIIPHRVPPQQTIGDAVRVMQRRLLVLLAERRLRALRMHASLSDAWYLGQMNHFTTTLSAPDEESLMDSCTHVVQALWQMAREGWCSYELEPVNKNLVAEQLRRLQQKDKSSGLWCDDFVDYAALGERYVHDTLQMKQVLSLVEKTKSKQLQRMLREWLQAGNSTQLIALRTNRKDVEEVPTTALTKQWERAWKAAKSSRLPKYEFCPVVEAKAEQHALPREIADVPTYADSVIVSRRLYPGLNIWDVHLNNGLRLLLKPTPSSDSVVHVSVVAPYGTSSIPAEKYAMWEGAAGYIDMGGTRTMPAEHLAEFQMSHDITLITSLEQHWHGFLGQTATKFSPLFYNFLREKWLHPELRYKDFDEVRREQLAGLGKETTLSRMLHRSPDHLLSKKLDEWVGHVLPIQYKEADSASLQQMTLDDVAAFYHRLYDATEGTTIILTGTFDADTEIRHLAAAFSLLPSKKPEAWRYPLWTAPSKQAEEWLKMGESTDGGNEVLHVERIMSGAYEPGLRNSLVLKLMRSALQQRVISEVREREGLVYSPFVSLYYDASPWRHFVLSVSLTAAPKNREKIMKVARRIEEELARKSLSEEELSQLKRPFLIAKHDQLPEHDAAPWRSAIERMVKNNETLEDFERYEDILESIRPVEVQRAFRNLISQKHWLFLAE